MIQVYFVGDSLNNLSTTINKELHELSRWLSSNKLTLNTDKSHYVLIYMTRLKRTKFIIYLSNIFLKLVNFSNSYVLSLMKRGISLILIVNSRKVLE